MGTGGQTGDDHTSGGAPSSGDGGEATGGAATTTGGATGAGGESKAEPVDWPLINGVQWADVEGQPIQAHGGGMLQVEDVYYWFGENRNPDGTFYAVSAYRSADLRRWEHAGDVLTMTSDPGLNPANVERPKVVYNARTGKYVMWMHWENGMDYGEARAAVASSDTVDGDYTFHGSFRPMVDSGVMDHGKPGYMSRDCTLFVDDDETAYFLSASNENYDLHLYELTDDYLEIEARVAVLFEGGHREAPALFKRNDRYFLVTSGSTGWSPNQAQYATSTSLTAGWTAMSNVADGNTFYSQSTYVQAIRGSEGTQYLYMGDRWAGSWGGRVNDSSYVWQAIAFPSESTMTMSWANHLDIDVSKGVISGSVDVFVLINEKSGLPLSVEGSESENGSDLVLGQEGEPVDFRLNYDAAGYFKLTSVDGGTVIDVPDESSQDGILLHLWDDNGGAHQAWKLIDVGQGKYRIQNKNSELYIGVTAGAVAPGSTIEQQSLGGQEQVWVLSPVE